MVFPHPFPHLWKTCSKPIFFCYLREYESQRIPCKYWKGKSGKAEFCSCGKPFRIRKNTTSFSSFHKDISLWKSLKSKKIRTLRRNQRKKKIFLLLKELFHSFSPSIPPFFHRFSLFRGCKNPWFFWAKPTFPQIPQPLRLLLRNIYNTLSLFIRFAEKDESEATGGNASSTVCTPFEANSAFAFQARSFKPRVMLPYGAKGSLIVLGFDALLYRPSHFKKLPKG